MLSILATRKWLRKSRKHMKNRRRRSNSMKNAVAVLLSTAFLLSCQQKKSDLLPENTFSLMTYNLYHYGLIDRDRDGQWDDPKPELEKKQILDTLAKTSPDVLAVQEIGNPLIFDTFIKELRLRQLEYPYTAYLQRGYAEHNLAVLSRFPITQKVYHTNDFYTSNGDKRHVTRGFLEVAIMVNPSYHFTLWVTHLKSKAYHRSGQTEMRRNEARILARHLSSSLQQKGDVNLAVVGDFNDDCLSAPVKDILEQQHYTLIDLRPQDDRGEYWTHYSQSVDTYSRIDYIAVTPGMIRELVSDGTRVVAEAKGSDHRPLLAVFKSTDQ